MEYSDAFIATVNKWRKQDKRKNTTLLNFITFKGYQTNANYKQFEYN